MTAAVTPGCEARACVAIDGRMLSAAQGSGVASYAATLARSIALSGYAPGLLTDHGRGGREATSGRRLRRLIRALPPGPRHAAPWAAPTVAGFEAGWSSADVFRTAHVHMRLHGRPLRLASSRPPAIMHWTYPVPMQFAGAANIYTVHDLIPLRRPDLTSIARARHQHTLRRLLAASRHIITVSETSRREVIETLGCGDDHVTCTYQAVDVAGAGTAPLPGGLARGGYLLALGPVEPRKNLQRLAKAHAASGTSLPLVIAGADGWRGTAISQALGGQPGVIRLPWQSRPQLLSLLAGAAGLAMPSLAEGFGLPVAEAMALGVPVITSREGALAEIAGGAALLVDPLDVRDIAGAIAALASDDALRRRLAAAGTERARAFTLEAHGRRLGAVYDRVLGR